MKAHVTDETARRLRENEVVWDDLDAGFGVRRQRRSSVFIVRYRTDRKRCCVTIGHHGELAAEDAREKARAILANVRKRTIGPDGDRKDGRYRLFTAYLTALS